MFLWIVKDIQLNKQFLHYVIYHGMAMLKQMELIKIAQFFSSCQLELHHELFNIISKPLEKYNFSLATWKLIFKE
jgi:hypothetical protein